MTGFHGKNNDLRGHEKPCCHSHCAKAGGDIKMTAPEFIQPFPPLMDQRCRRPDAKGKGRLKPVSVPCNSELRNFS